MKRLFPKWLKAEIERITEERRSLRNVIAHRKRTGCTNHRAIYELM